VNAFVADQMPAVLHANSTPAMCYALRTHTCPVVWHVRDLAPLGRWGGWLYRHAARVAVISTAVHEDVARYAHGPDKRVLVPPAVDTARFHPAEDRAALKHRLGLPDDAPLIGMVAQFVPWKRHDLLLDALALITGMDWHLVLAGADLHQPQEYLAAVRARMAQPALIDRVTWRPWLDDPSALMAALDICVLTSRREPFGRALLEAMACGAPCIAIDDAGPRDLIAHEQNGLLVGETPREIADAIARLLANADVRGAMGAAGRACALDRFSLATQRAVLANLYGELMC
jgi:mannosyltransferase